MELTAPGGTKKPKQSEPCGPAKPTRPEEAGSIARPSGLGPADPSGARSPYGARVRASPRPLALEAPSDEIRSPGGANESPGRLAACSPSLPSRRPPTATYRDAGRNYLGGRGDAPFPRTRVPSARQHQLSFQHKHQSSSWGASLPQLRPAPAEVTQGGRVYSPAGEELLRLAEAAASPSAAAPQTCAAAPQTCAIEHG